MVKKLGCKDKKINQTETKGMTDEKGFLTNGTAQMTKIKGCDGKSACQFTKNFFEFLFLFVH